MPVDLRCPKCDSKFEAKSSSIGFSVRCPDCEARFVAEDPDDDRDRDERESDRPRREFARPRRRTRRRTKRSSAAPLVVGLVLALLVVGFGIFALFKWVINDNEKWESLEVPGHFRVMMPGKPEKKTQPSPAGQVHAYELEIDKDTGFIVVYVELVLPRELQMHEIELVLDQMCQELPRHIPSRLEARESRRETIRLQGYPGRQVTLEAVRSLKATCRMFVTGRGIYVLVAAGRGYTPEHKSVKRFFDSFEILDGRQGAGANPQQQMPFQQPNQQPPVQPKPKSSWDQADQTVLGAKPADAKLKVSGSTVYLSDMSEFGGRPCAIGWSFTKNGNLGESFSPNRMVIVNGVTPAHVLSMAPPLNDYTRICYSLGKKAKSFEGFAALSEYPASMLAQPTRFLVLGDGKVLWRSEPIKAQRQFRPFSIDVSNVNILELRTFSENGFNHGCAAVWVDPLVRVK